MLTRAVSESGSNSNSNNNNSNNKPIVKRLLQPSEEAVVVREKPLIEFIQECPSLCALNQWPLYNEEKEPECFNCWTEFCSYAKLTIRCEIPRLIQLLTPLLLIRPEEKQLYQSAKFFWDKFNLPQSSSSQQGPFTVILRSEHGVPLGEHIELLNNDKKQDWSWQRKLVFLLVCVFSSKKFINMQSNSLEMDPKLNGVVYSILDKIKSPSRGFLPTFSNTHRYKSQLLGNMVHYWEMHYRSSCGGMNITNPTLSRYPKQEKLYFLLLAHNFLMYYKPQSKEWNNNCLLGLLRMMFSIQATGNEDVSIMPWYYSQSQQLQSDLEALFHNAKTINRLIKSNNVTIQWLSEEHKRRDLLKEAVELLTVLPLKSVYLQGVSDAFHINSLTLQYAPHGTRFLQYAEVKDKLVACLDHQLQSTLAHTEKFLYLYILIENQIAQPVHEYYSKMMNLLMNQTGDLPLSVNDIMDPELQRHCVLLIIPNESYYFIQALSWARWVFVTYSNTYKVLPEFKAVYALLLGFCSQEIAVQLLIAILRVLLLGHSVEKVAADMEQVAKHAKMASSILERNMYQLPKQDGNTPLPSRFTTMNSRHLIRQLSEYAQAIVIILLLFPWLDKVKIPRRNHLLLKKMLCYWGKNKSQDGSIIHQSKIESDKLLNDETFDYPSLCFKNDEIKDLENLAKQSTAGIGSLEDLEVILNLASAARVPSLRLIALIGCLVPILPVTREYFMSLFDATDGTISNDYTEYTPNHSVKWTKMNNTALDTLGQKFSCDELIHELCNIHTNRNNFYYIQGAFIESRVPKLPQLKQAVLPIYTHNGELMNPLFTSFLQTVPERKHCDDDIALKAQLNDKYKHKRNRGSEDLLIIPELNLNALSNNNSNNNDPPSAVELYDPASPMIEG